MGKFDGNIRSSKPLNNDELRAAMKDGWNEHLPAIKDENGTLLVGHRRMKIAEELNLKPVIKTVTFGSGPEAEAARIRLANVSNIGGAPMTAEDRKHQAVKLYNSGLTQQAIAHMLGVSQWTISQDLRNLETPINQKPNKTPTNPKGAGRPKGTKKARKNESMTAEAAAKLILDNDWNYPKAERETGLSNTVLRSAVAREEGRRQPQPDTTAPSLSMTAQEKLQAAIRAHKRQLEIDFETRVITECQRRLNEISLPHYAKQMEDLERSITNRKGVMDRITYRKILACLHPDRVTDQAMKKRFEEAFRLFTALEKRVLDEKQSPTTFRKMPRTYEELMAMKAKVQAERRAKRSKSAVQ